MRPTGPPRAQRGGDPPLPVSAQAQPHHEDPPASSPATEGVSRPWNPPSAWPPPSSPQCPTLGSRLYKHWKNSGKIHRRGSNSLGPTDHLLGPALALKPIGNNGPLRGPHSPLSPQLTHMAPSKNRPGQARQRLPAWGHRGSQPSPALPRPLWALGRHLYDRSGPPHPSFSGEEVTLWSERQCREERTPFVRGSTRC